MGGPEISKRKLNLKRYILSRVSLANGKIFEKVDIIILTKKTPKNPKKQKQKLHALAKWSCYGYLPFDLILIYNINKNILDIFTFFVSWSLLRHHNSMSFFYPYEFNLLSIYRMDKIIVALWRSKLAFFIPDSDSTINPICNNFYFFYYWIPTDCGYVYFL